MVFGVESGLDKVTLLASGHLSQNVELTTYYRPSRGLFFQYDSDRSVDALWGEPGFAKLPCEVHSEADCERSSDLLGTGASSVFAAGAEILAFSERVALGGDHTSAV